MHKLKAGWTLSAVVAGVLPLSIVLTGCKGKYSGGPSDVIITTRTPTPSGTPSLTPVSTPASTPTSGAINSALVGNYSGTFSLAAFQEVNRTLTMSIKSDGAITASIPLSLGGTLPFTGTVDATGTTVTLTGQAQDATSGVPIIITLSGRLNISGGSSVSGGGTVRDDQNDSGTWSARKSVG